MRTALAILDGERSKVRLSGLTVELDEAGRQDAQVGEELALIREEIGMAERLSSVSARIANDRRALSEQLEATKKQVANEKQKLVDQLAGEKCHVEALDAIRAAELDLKTADTILASDYAKAKYTAAIAMLQEAHRQFRAGKWDEAIARAPIARTEVGAAIETARPHYEQAEQVKLTSIRDHDLEEAASAIVGVTTRFERQKDLQKLVLVLPHLFGAQQGTCAAEGAKTLDAVKDLLAAFPSCPIQVSGFRDDQGKPGNLVASSLARANAVYWALVARGIDPRRMSIDGRGAADPIAENTSAAGRALNSRIEIAILCHALFDIEAR